LTDKRVHGILDRGEHAEISTYISKAVDNEFSGNMIDVCPVGALTDKTFRFKNRVWFTKPVDAHRTCDTPGCCGNTTLWLRGEEVFRVTARKDEWGEVKSYDGKPGWICNTCRFDKKKTSDWTIEGVTKVNRHSVISQGKYEGLVMPKETVQEVMGGRAPKLLMNIHDESEVNDPKIQLSEINGPAHAENFKN
jgi:NADH-quinone oxidoreductase subunit G